MKKGAIDKQLDRILSRKEILKKIQRDLDKIKEQLPLVSVGPSGIGGEYQKEIK